MQNLSKIDVYILCGGLGKRLRSVSKQCPKPMIKIGDKPFLDILLDYMARKGFKRFILGIGYRADLFKKYYTNYKNKDISITFCAEKFPLGTGGAVKKAEKKIKSNLFLVLNGDSFCEFDPMDFLKFHRVKNAVISILLRKIKNAADYGCVKLDKQGKITSFDEKNSRNANCFINAGIYIFNKNIVSLMPEEKVFSLERDFFPAIIGNDCFGYKKSGFFIDIGTPERYFKAKKYLIKGTANGRV